MAKIRDDLEGAVHVYVNGIPIGPLVAGDEIPAGAEVGDHLIASKESKESKESKDSIPDGRAGRDAWAEYAKSVGIEIAEDATKADIRAVVEAAESK